MCSYVKMDGGSEVLPTYHLTGFVDADRRHEPPRSETIVHDTLT